MDKFFSVPEAARRLGGDFGKADPTHYNNTWNSTWSEVRFLMKTFGRAEVLEAFEEGNGSRQRGLQWQVSRICLYPGSSRNSSRHYQTHERS